MRIGFVCLHNKYDVNMIGAYPRLAKRKIRVSVQAGTCEMTCSVAYPR